MRLGFMQLRANANENVLIVLPADQIKSRGCALELLKESVLVSYEHKINNHFRQTLLTHPFF